MGIPVASITSEGTKLDETIEVLSIEIRRALNRVPEATLVLLDGSMAGRRFAVSDGAFFEPGRPIEIALGYLGEDAETSLFDGLVVRHAVETKADGSELRIELKDHAFQLTRERNSAVFHKMSDDELIRKVIEAAGTKAPKIKVGSIEHAKVRVIHEQLIQFYASDWDFIVSRADVNGLVVDVDRGVISVRPMAQASEAKLAIAHGLGELSELELEIDAGQQWAEIESVGWDLPKQQRSAPKQAEPPRPAVKVGNLDAAAIAAKLGGGRYTLLHPGALEQAELAAWADARLARSRLALLRGRAVIAGNPALAPLDGIALTGVGKRFDSQKVLISGVTHRVDQDGWQTELELGLSPDWFAHRSDIAEVSAAGLLPPVSGLRIATVAAFEVDPQGEHRIRVKLPVFDDQQGFLWARVARPDAGKQRGQVFWPEPGDEVVLGFLDGDPRQAIVLGSLHGSANPPPAAGAGPSEDNAKRAIVSKAGSLICFDDDKGSITVETAGKNRIQIDDAAEVITIADQHGNSITMDKSGIRLKSASNLMLDAVGEVVIKGNAVDIQ